MCQVFSAQWIAVYCGKQERGCCPRTLLCNTFDNFCTVTPVTEAKLQRALKTTRFFPCSAPEMRNASSGDHTRVFSMKFL